MLQKARGLVEGLVLHPERALATLTEGSHGLVFSQSVLLALVSGGLSRDAAYRIVQRDARAAWDEGRPFRQVLDDGPRGHAVRRTPSTRPSTSPAPCATSTGSPMPWRSSPHDRFIDQPTR